MVAIPSTRMEYVLGRLWVLSSEVEWVEFWSSGVIVSVGAGEGSRSSGGVGDVMEEVELAGEGDFAAGRLRGV